MKPQASASDVNVNADNKVIQSPLSSLSSVSSSSSSFDSSLCDTGSRIVDDVICVEVGLSDAGVAVQSATNLNVKPLASSQSEPSLHLANCAGSCSTTSKSSSDGTNEDEDGDDVNKMASHDKSASVDNLSNILSAVAIIKEENEFKTLDELVAQPGDLIQINRGLYSHWALYAGNGHVVHVAGARGQEVTTMGMARVFECSLADVAGHSLVRVNNKNTQAAARSLAALPSDAIVERVRQLIGCSVPYHVITKNCEHYVTEWRFGQAWSDQVTDAASTLGSLATKMLAAFQRRMMRSLQHSGTTSVTSSTVDGHVTAEGDEEISYHDNSDANATGTDDDNCNRSGPSSNSLLTDLNRILQRTLPAQYRDATVGPPSYDTINGDTNPH